MSASHRIRIEHASESIGDFRRQAPVVGAHASPALVVKHFVYNSQTLTTPLLHAPARRGLYLVAGWGSSIHLVQAILLKKQWVAQVRDGTRPLSVRSAGGRIAVRGYTHKTVPVAEVAQLAGVYLVHGLPVHHAVLASPEPVAALNDKIHLRHFSDDGDGTLFRRLVDLRVQDAHYHNIVFLFVPYNGGPVQSLHAGFHNAGYCHTIVLFKLLPDAGCGDFHIGRNYGHPHGTGFAVNLQCVRRCRGVQPIFAVFRILRCRCSCNYIQPSPIHRAQAKSYIRQIGRASCRERV